MKMRISTQHLTVAQKLAAGFLLVLTVFIAAAWFNFMQVQSMKTQIGRQNGKTDLMLTALQLKAMTQDLQDVSAGLMISRDPQYAKKFKGKQDEYNRLLQKVESTAATLEQIGWRSQLIMASTDFLDTFSRAEAIIGNSQLAAADVQENMASIYKQTQEQRDAIFGLVDKFYAGYADDAQTATAATFGLMNRTVQLFAGASLFVLLVTIIVSWLLTRSVTRPIRRIRRAVDRLATGDLSAKINDNGRDEFGDLSRQFDAMVDRVREMLAGTQNIALSLGEHAESFQLFSGETAKANREIVRAIHEIATGASGQADSSEASARLISTLNAQLAGISEVAEHMQHDGQQAKARTDSGSAAMHGLRETTRHAEELFALVAEAMQELTEGSAQIGEIVALITDVAAQTNILALNASIEASRAGEDGKGFSVIAEEIRKMAHRTGGLSNRIGDIIGSLQLQTHELAERIGLAQEGVRAQSEYVDESLDSFAAIRESLEQIIARIREIYEDIAAAKRQNDNLIESAAYIAAIAQQTAASVQEVSASSQQQDVSIDGIARRADGIRQLASQLTHEMGRFRIGA